MMEKIKIQKEAKQVQEIETPIIEQEPDSDIIWQGDENYKYDDYRLAEIQDKITEGDTLTEEEKQIWNENQLSPEGFRYDYEGNLIPINAPEGAKYIGKSSELYDIEDICKEADKNKITIIAEVQFEDVEYYKSLGFKIKE